MRTITGEKEKIERVLQDVQQETTMLQQGTNMLQHGTNVLQHSISEVHTAALAAAAKKERERKTREHEEEIRKLKKEAFFGGNLECMSAEEKQRALHAACRHSRMEEVCV